MLNELNEPFDPVGVAPVRDIPDAGLHPGLFRFVPFGNVECLATEITAQFVDCGRLLREPLPEPAQSIMRAGDDLHADDLADLGRGGGAGVSRGFHAGDIAAEERAAVEKAKALLSDAGVSDLKYRVRLDPRHALEDEVLRKSALPFGLETALA